VVVGVTRVRNSWLIRSVELVTLNVYGRGAKWLILWLKDLLCNFVISSVLHHVRPNDGLIEKGPKHDVYLLTPYTLIKFLLCFDLPTLYQL